MRLLTCLLLSLSFLVASASAGSRDVSPNDRQTMQSFGVAQLPAAASTPRAEPVPSLAVGPVLLGAPKLNTGSEPPAAAVLPQRGDDTAHVAGNGDASGLVGAPLVAIKGEATYYATCRFCAAASGELQDLIGPDWQGSFVTVTRGSRHVVVRLTTGCGCGPHPAGWQPVIDLSTQSFARLGPLSAGHISVVVSWESGPSQTLPPTDTEETP